MTQKKEERILRNTLLQYIVGNACCIQDYVQKLSIFIWFRIERKETMAGNWGDKNIVETIDYGKEYAPKRPVKVIKKDGSTEAFNVQKVISAVGEVTQLLRTPKLRVHRLIL